MRLLIVSNTYPPADISGVGALVHELAHQLGDAGHHVRVLTREAPQADEYAIATGGGKGAYPLLAGLRYLWMALRGRFDLVHVHESDGAFVVLAHRFWRLFSFLGIRAGRGRLVATLQVSYDRERECIRPILADGKAVSEPTADERAFARWRAPAHAFLGRLTTRLSDALVAPSNVTAQELKEDYGAKQVDVIYNGIATDWAAAPSPSTAESGPFASSAADQQGHLTLLYVGRMRTRKAVAVLLVAFERLLREFPDARLILVGGGEQKPALEQQAKDLDLGDAVQFLGPIARDEVMQLYAAADVYCLPSIYEGFPVAILEAMAAGLPVVSTTVSGIPEAVVHGETGLLVPPEEASSLAAALAELAGDPIRRRRMGEAGRSRLMKEFTIDVISAEYLQLWQNLAGSDVRAAE